MNVIFDEINWLIFVNWWWVFFIIKDIIVRKNFCEKLLTMKNFIKFFIYLFFGILGKNNFWNNLSGKNLNYLDTVLLNVNNLKKAKK